MIKSQSILVKDEAQNIRGRVIGIYVLLIGANIAAWVWALVVFRNYPIY